MQTCPQRILVKIEYQTNQEALNEQIDANDYRVNPKNNTSKQFHSQSFEFRDYPGQQKGKKFNNGEVLQSHKTPRQNAELVTALRQQANFAAMSDQQIQQIISSNETCTFVPEEYVRQEKQFMQAEQRAQRNEKRDKIKDSKVAKKSRHSVQSN